MQNEIIKQQSVQEVIIPKETLDNMLAFVKKGYLDKLSINNESDIILAKAYSLQDMPISTLEEFDLYTERMKVIKKDLSTFKEIRVGITNELSSKLIDPFISREKQLEEKVNNIFSIKDKQGLELRKKINDDQARQRAINDQKNRLDLLLRNEIMKYKASFKSLLMNDISKYISQQLEVGNNNVNEISLTCEERVNYFQISFPIIDFKAFDLLTADEIKEIQTRNNYYDVRTDIERVEVSEYVMEQLFNWKNKIEQKEEAKALMLAQQQKLEKEQADRMSMQQAMNSIQQVAIPMMHTEEVKIKVNYLIDMPDTKETALAILGVHLANIDKMPVTIKSWTSYGVGNAIKAIEKYKTNNPNIVFDGINFKISEK